MVKLSTKVGWKYLEQKLPLLITTWRLETNLIVQGGGGRPFGSAAVVEAGVRGMGAIRLALVLGFLAALTISLLAEPTPTAESTTGWARMIEIRGDPDFIWNVGRALNIIDQAGWGRFVYLNIARIEPATKNPDVGGYILFSRDGTRGVVYLNAVFVPRSDWIAGAIVEEAVHQSQRNNGHPACGRRAEYIAAWVRWTFAETAGIEGVHQLRDWDSIPDEPCWEENR